MTLNLTRRMILNKPSAQWTMQDIARAQEFITQLQEHLKEAHKALPEPNSYKGTQWALYLQEKDRLTSTEFSLKYGRVYEDLLKSIRLTKSHFLTFFNILTKG